MGTGTLVSVITIVVIFVVIALIIFKMGKDDD